MDIRIGTICMTEKAKTFSLDYLSLRYDVFSDTKQKLTLLRHMLFFMAHFRFIWFSWPILKYILQFTTKNLQYRYFMLSQ